MAEGQNDQEKTEAPTERRREELRREGQFAYSKEVPGTIIFGGLLLSLYMFGSFLMRSIAAMFQKSFSNFALGDFSGPSVSAVLQFISLDFLFWVAILLLFLFVLGLAAGIGQIGLHWSAKSIMPDLLKINPLTGFGRIFSINNLMESIKILLKVILVGYVCYSVIASDLLNILHYSLQDKDLYLFNLWKILETLLFKLFLSFLLLASLDYLWQRISFERRIRMSRQELKEEMRQSEGDPLIKARIRQIQQKMSRARMLQEVPKADLVLANPTHYAVVIKYEPGVMVAPQVVAKGLDYLALRIIEIAQKAGVVVSREPALARSLYGALEIGDAIPEEYYALVAEVLAKAYKIKGRKLAS